jgi:hypothetical protein
MIARPVIPFGGAVIGQQAEHLAQVTVLECDANRIVESGGSLPVIARSPPSPSPPDRDTVPAPNAES